MTLVVTLLPGYNAMILGVSNEHGIIVIHNEILRVTELSKLIPFSVITRNSDPFLCPTCI
jgi:hypothetical protein